MTRVQRSVLVIASALVALVHLAALPPALEDLDSVNFALGVERFDLAQHRPHPPGYPVYIAAGRLSSRVLTWAAPHWSRDRRAAVGLALWSALAAAIALWVLTRFWMAIGLTAVQSLCAAALAVVAPLFWLTASRPLSDYPVWSPRWPCSGLW